MNSPETIEENENNLIDVRSSFNLSQNAIRTTFNTMFTKRFFFGFAFMERDTYVFFERLNPRVNLFALRHKIFDIG